MGGPGTQRGRSSVSDTYCRNPRLEAGRITASMRGSHQKGPHDKRPLPKWQARNSGDCAPWPPTHQPVRCVCSSRPPADGLTKRSQLRSGMADWNVGAEWHRWDPHIHTPVTLHANGFGGDWADYLQRINRATPAVRALGVTEYGCLLGYRELRSRWDAGDLPQVELLFPNVELRLDIQTARDRPVNLHLLFSPDDPDHEDQIERMLGQLRFEFRRTTYQCIESDLIRLGRAVDSDQTDRRGALIKGTEQFKVDLNQLRDLFRTEHWFRQNCLLAVAASPRDGTAGIEGGAFWALRTELEGFMHIIFSGSPADRDYWLGRKDGYDKQYLIDHYGGCKPCLHGSDAHRPEQVVSPAEDRFCWIKADLSFDGLRQVLFEPADRVRIGPNPPPQPPDYETVHALRVSNAQWVSDERFEFNRGLVAIIGPKGSGKTALADMLAHSAGARVDPQDSFVTKAAPLLGETAVDVTWRDGTASPTRQLASPLPPDSESQIRYLSQQFVERLCSADGLGGDLLDEIEGVIFNAIDETERMGAADFTALRHLRLLHVHEARRQHIEAIQRNSRRILEEEALLEAAPRKVARLEELDRRVEGAKAELKALLPETKTNEVKRLASVEDICRDAEKRVQDLKVRRARLRELRVAADATLTSWKDQVRELAARFPDCGLTTADWECFTPRFSSDVDALLHDRIETVELALRRAEGVAGEPPPTEEELAKWPLSPLREERQRLKEIVGVEQQRAKKYEQSERRLRTLSTERNALIKELQRAEKANAFRREAIAARRAAYAEIFETYVQEQAILEGLYAPLTADLDGQGGGVERLSLAVKRRVDLDAWAERGESLVDLRKSGKFQGHGALYNLARKELLPSWVGGGSEEVAGALHRFFEAHGRELRNNIRSGTSVPSVAEWLFSTDHVSLEYSIEYDHLDLRKLSPGIRGIVLLLLYLAVDRWDSRPLIIDQPEENLDPQSVYDELVSFFRTARGRRQIILITHNANLVVNADADQVIVARAERHERDQLPSISYLSGPLERADMREEVCRILEGGKQAFLEREKRYGILRE